MFTERKCPAATLAVIFLCCLGHQETHGFNVDTDHALVKSGARGSYFGYDVSLFKTASRPWLLVGAPLAQTTEEGGVLNGGAIYRCSLEEDGCQELVVDTKSSQYVNKSGQWLGASVASSGEHGTILACAPRNVYLSLQKNAVHQPGVCFLYKEGFDIEEISPCRKELDKHPTDLIQTSEYGVCQLGFSASLTKDGNRIWLGSPGALYFCGMIYTRDLDSRNEAHVPDYSIIENDDSYIGYSGVSGDFTGDGIEDYAVGVPRWEASQLLGRVWVIEQDLSFVVNVSGEQMGEYFGYALAASDLNGDGRADLVVGAPMYTNYKKLRNYESGRVYVFYYWQPAAPHYFHVSKRDFIYGRGRFQARFGHAVAGLKDINGDRYEDIAVGAPYEGDNQEGAVYIYLGSSSGVRSKPSQIISGNDIRRPFSNFGFSITAGTDMDDNGYPDILVGALGSDSVVFLRSRAVITVDVELIFNNEMIKLDDKVCNDSASNPVVCFPFRYCLTYKGESVPANIELSLDVLLDSSRRRALFLDGSNTESRNITLERAQQNCRHFYSYIKNNIQDKLSPITVEIDYTLNTRDQELPPVLDQDDSTYITKEAHIWRDCGEDDQCIPDLSIQVTSKTPTYVIGSPEPIFLDVIVHNSGENAYEAIVLMRLPREVTKRTVKQHGSYTNVICSFAAGENENRVSCEVGNPLPANVTTSFTIGLSGAEINGDTSSMELGLSVSSTNTENPENGDDNTVNVQVNITAQADISIAGIVKPEHVIFNTTDYDFPVTTIEDIGPEVIYVYTIQNMGPTTVSTLAFSMYWLQYMESTTSQELDFMYLTETPRFTEGDGKCSSDYVDHMDLNIQNRSDERSIRNIRSLMSSESEEQQFWDMTCRDQTSGCSEILCQADYLEAGQVATIEVRYRLWVRSLIKEGLDGYAMSSRAEAKVTTIPYLIQPQYYDAKDVQIDLAVSAVDPTTKFELPLWVIVTSAAAGLVLFVVLVVILWKCGFFHRQTQEEMEDIVMKKEIRESLIITAAIGGIDQDVVN